MPKIQAFNSNAQIYADFWNISGLDLQVALLLKIYTFILSNKDYDETSQDFKSNYS